MNGDIYKRSDQALFAEVGDDVVALHIERGSSYGMEHVSAAVWRLLSEPRDIDEICSELLKQYNVAYDTCRTEVARLLGQFESERLVSRLSPSESTAVRSPAD